MNNASQTLDVALRFLPLIQFGITEFIAWITALRAIAKQSGEWTDAQEASFRDGLINSGIAPEELPD